MGLLKQMCQLPPNLLPQTYCGPLHYSPLNFYHLDTPLHFSTIKNGLEDEGQLSGII